MLSVIIPTYNGIETLRQSLPTWMEQTFPQDEYEVLVVDNHSTDNTKEEVHRMIAGHPNFHYLDEPQQGATAARHAGARASKGDILVFADNDGLFNTECLERIKEVYDGNSECEAVTGKIEILWDTEEPEWIKPYKFMLGQLNYGDKIRYGYDMYLNGGLMSVKKSTFERLHGFNPDLVGKYLIGDGDTGFVKKLFENHCLMGYTPFAIMQHMQKVAIHGSESGLALHFYNNGIADAYALYRKNHFTMTHEVKICKLKHKMCLLKKKVQYLFMRHNRRRIFFSVKQNRGFLQFFDYLRQPDLAEIIRQENVY